MVIGRSSHVAMGVTNAYGDCQDLYVETVDPQDPSRYMEGTASVPFHIITETLKIRDKEAPNGYRTEKLRIRFTRRGPVVSGVLPGLGSHRVITLRWAASETMEPSIGLEAALTAKSVADLRTALKSLNFIVLNWVFADSAGNTGWHVSGKLPIRSQKDSTLPYRVRDGSDNWVGWIPFHEMPHAENPARGWIGTCNHKTTAADYPYYFSSYFSPSYRYRRLKELLDAPGSSSAVEHWQYARDTMNVMARTIAPVMARALLSGEDTREMGRILEKWDFRDEPDTAAPTIFQLVYRNFVRSVLDANLGAEIASLVLGEGYFWEERFQRMVERGSSPWLEKALKARNASSMDDLFRRVGSETAQELSALLGKDPASWLWGNAHTLQFVHPLRRNGVGMSLLGAGPYPMGGSRETLYCAWYDFNNPFSVVLSASLRMVADLGDEEKVMAVIPGGVSGRTLDAHMKDQIPPYMDGTPVYWWFSDQAIRTHGKHVLPLVPK